MLGGEGVEMGLRERDGETRRVVKCGVKCHTECQMLQEIDTRFSCVCDT
jgi:hypothetical protein